MSKKKIIHIMKTIKEHKYFHFKQQYSKQRDGLAMGAPTFMILALAEAYSGGTK
jgi:hypothetical protein